MKYAFLFILGCFACSCATVVRGTSDTAAFQSEPSGANVTAESISEDKQGPYYCVTPCELELKRKRTWKVDFSLEGYKPVSGLLKPEVTAGGVAAGAGNALIGGIIGIGIDAGTGANLDLRPNPMIAELEPIDSSEMSRIPDAELIVSDPLDEVESDIEEGAGGVDEEIAPATQSPETSDEQASPDGSVLESADDALVDEEAAVDVESGKNINFETDVDAIQPVEVSNDVSTPQGHLSVKHYKPGEPAPNDEEADDLNKQQLNRVLPESQ